MAWPGHEVCIAIFKETFFKFNRGQGSEDHKGILCYKIGNPSNLPEAFAKLFNMEVIEENPKNKKEFKTLEAKKIESSIEFFKHGINQLLELELSFSDIQKSQPSGNCSWLAAQASLCLALIECYIRQGFTPKKALGLGMYAYKKWAKFDRLSALEDLKAIEESPLKAKFEGIVDFIGLNKTILFRNLKTSKIKIIQNILNKNLLPLENYKFLIENILDKNVEKTISSIHKLSFEEMDAFFLDKLALFCCDKDQFFAYHVAKELNQ